MEFVLNKLSIKNFKGIRERTIEFGDWLQKIEGKNASGKTTVMDAFFWLFNDTDSELKSNPPIFPIGVAECTPEVEAEFSVDGRVNRLKKMQVRKITEVGDTRKVALSNSFLFNDVPMAQRDVAKKFEELGVDFSRFAVLAHPSAFLAMKKDDQRRMLFEMANDLTDCDIAERIGTEVFEAHEMLKKYKFDEVKAMANATLKKINEVYGKKGEIWNSKIEGLSMSKVEYPFSDLELLKNDLTEQLNGITEQRKSNTEIEKNVGILQEKSMTLQFELSGLKSNLSATKTATLDKLKKDMDEKKADVDSKYKNFRELQTDLQTTCNRLGYAQKELGVAAAMLDTAVNSQFDEKSTICPTCGQLLPETDIQGLKAKFESDRDEKIKKYQGEIEEAETLISGYEEKMKALETEIAASNENGKVVQNAYVEAKNKYEAYKLVPEDEPTEEIKAKEQELSAINVQIEETKKGYIPNLDFKESELREQLRDTELKLNQAHTNAMIDEKIAELREQQVGFEQDRANTERLLFQLDKIQKEKNNLLADEINSHFSLVKFEFFTWLKNGSYSECCNVLCNGKELNAALNTAMQIRAKIDICNGFQKFYDQRFTIWLDGAEALDADSQKALFDDLGTQLVLLAVKD